MKSNFRKSNQEKKQRTYTKIKQIGLKAITLKGANQKNLTVIIVRVPSIKIPVLFAQRRPERDRHRI